MLRVKKSTAVVKKITTDIALHVPIDGLVSIIFGYSFPTLNGKIKQSVENKQLTGGHVNGCPGTDQEIEGDYEPQINKDGKVVLKYNGHYECDMFGHESRDESTEFSLPSDDEKLVKKIEWAMYTKGGYFTGDSEDLSIRSFVEQIPYYEEYKAQFFECVDSGDEADNESD